MEDTNNTSLSETPKKDVPSSDSSITPVKHEERESSVDATPPINRRKQNPENSGSPGKKFRFDFTGIPIRRFPNVSLPSQYILTAAGRTGAATEEVLKYLREQKTSGDGKLAAEWTEIEDMFTKRLWHELSLKVLAMAKHPTLASQDAQVNLYENLTLNFDLKIDPLLAIAITEPLIYNIVDKKAALDFLCYLLMRYRDHREVIAVIELLQGEIGLCHLNDLEEGGLAVLSLEHVKLPTSKYLDIHGRFYALAERYYGLTRDYNKLYKYGMLAWPKNQRNMSHDRLCKEAFCLAISAVIGYSVFDFLPLLQHPMMEWLKVSKYRWVIGLLHACNSGDAAEFLREKPIWNRVLSKFSTKIHYKVAVNGVREMVLRGPPFRKIFTIDEIMAKTLYSEDEAERFILKAFARNMFKGSIDGNRREITIKWVKPRMKSLSQIQQLQTEVHDWTTVTSAMKLFVETELEVDSILHC